MRLDKNFSLEEFLLSQTATRQGIDMTPPQAVIDNLQELVVLCLQPLRDHLGGSVFISSGYRPPELNVAIGGSATSEHCNGNAADFTVVGFTPFEVCEAIKELRLPYDQNIHEFGRWTHLGIRANLRLTDLTAYKKDGHTVYVPGIVKMEDL